LAGEQNDKLWRILQCFPAPVGQQGRLDTDAGEEVYPEQFY